MFSCLGRRRAVPNEADGADERTLVLCAPKLDLGLMYSEDVDFLRTRADGMAGQGADGLEGY